MRSPSDDQVNYFGEKMAKRMKDFAIHNYKQPMETRGRNCLDAFKKNSNPEWAQQFFLLILECWVNWIALARSRPSLKGSKKIMKSFESLEKYNIALPRTQRLFTQFNMMEPEPAPIRNQPAPVTQKPSGGDNRGSTAGQPTQSNPSRQANAPKEDEKKVLDFCSQVKTMIIQSSEMFPESEEDAELAQAILYEINQTYERQAKMLKAVVSRATEYQANVVENATAVVKAIETFIKDFDRFDRGEINFDDFRRIFFDIVSNLNSSPKHSQPSRTVAARQPDPESARNEMPVSKRDDKPVTNIDMNSYMSAAMKQKARQDDDGDDEDELRLPDWNSPEEPEEPSNIPRSKPAKPEDPFESNAKDDDNEDDFEYQAEEMDDSVQVAGKANEESKASLRNSDRKGRQSTQQGASRFKFSEGDEDDERNQVKINKDAKNNKLKPEPLRLSHISDSYQYSRDETPKPEKSLAKSPYTITEQPGDANQSGPTNKNQSKKSEKNGILEPTSEFTVDAKQKKARSGPIPAFVSSATSIKESGSPAGSPKFMTEEEKIKLALKNQKVLENPETLNAMNDFFSAGDEKPVSVADVFARAKMRAQQGKPTSTPTESPAADAEKKTSPKPSVPKLEPVKQDPPKTQETVAPKKVQPKKTSKKADGFFESEVIDAQKDAHNEDDGELQEEPNPEEHWDMDPDAQEFFQTDEFFNTDNNKPGMDFAGGFFGSHY